MKAPAGREGLFTSLRNLATTLLATAGTRVELLGNELEAQKLQALRMLMLAQAMLFCAAVGLCLLVGFAALLWWEQRLVVVGAGFVLFGIATALCYRALMRMVNAPEAPFAATLEELRRDVENLKTANQHANPPD